MWRIFAPPEHNHQKSQPMALRLVRTITELQHFADSIRAEGKSIGCVPTMGYLHSGHASLVSASASENNETITTIFVNPTQFAPTEDLSRYPRDFERDYTLAEEAGCTVLFYPDTAEMYPEGYSTSIQISGITEKFEGVFRPTHFSGVATVVTKLLLAAKPHRAYFGQKDYQQTLVVQRLNTDLNIDCNIIVLPTVREDDGLAKSSRNVYLSPTERQDALALWRALTAVGEAVSAGERRRDALNNVCRKILSEIPAGTIDYAAVARASSLDEPEKFTKGDSVVCLIAVRIGTTRLIDNAIFTIQ